MTLHIEEHCIKQLVTMDDALAVVEEVFHVNAAEVFD
jgi:hypothetical protein